MISTLGPRMNSVFRSRWRAVWWSAGVLLTAYCSVPAMTHKDASGAKGDAAASAKADSDEQAKRVRQLAHLLGDDPKPKAGDHANPWAKSAPKAVHIKGE